MKTDARVRFTKMVIKDSFVRLLREIPFSKITVKGICETAEINRATFYKYYADPYDLMDQIKAEHFLELQKILEKTDNNNLLETLTVVTNTIKEHHDLYTLMFVNSGDNTFVNQIFALCYQAKESSIGDMLPGIPKAQQEWFYYFLAQGCSSILDCWVRNGMKEEPEEVSQFINMLNTKLLQTYEQTENYH